jgi:hypothetical protein
MAGIAPSMNGFACSAAPREWGLPLVLLIARDTFRVRSIEFVDLFCVGFVRPIPALTSFGQFPHWLRSANSRIGFVRPKCGIRPLSTSLSRNCRRDFSFPFLSEALRFA